MFFKSIDGLIEVSPHSPYFMVSVVVKRSRETDEGRRKKRRVRRRVGEMRKVALIGTKSGGEVGLSQCGVLMR